MNTLLINTIALFLAISIAHARQNTQPPDSPQTPDLPPPASPEEPASPGLEQATEVMVYTVHHPFQHGASATIEIKKIDEHSFNDEDWNIGSETEIDGILKYTDPDDTEKEIPISHLLHSSWAGYIYFYYDNDETLLELPTMRNNPLEENDDSSEDMEVDDEYNMCTTDSPCDLDMSIFEYVINRNHNP